jgi:hypothetical protein
MLRIMLPTSTITFEGVEKTSYKKGGWKIHYDVTTAPDVAQSEVRLLIYKKSAGRNAPEEYIRRLPSVPISGMMPQSSFQYILWYINCLDIWDQVAEACLVRRLWTRSGRYSVLYSAPVDFDCPVRPVMGCNFAVGSVDTVKQLGELCKNDRVPWKENASMLAPIDVFGRKLLMFHAGRKLLTSDDDRNLDRALNCITFADAALGLDSDNVADENGEDIADYVGKDNALTGAATPQLLEFFSDKNENEWSNSSYVFWWDTTSEGHVVIISNGSVYEYSKSEGGFKFWEDVDDYFHKVKFIKVKGNLREIVPQ